MLTSSGGNNGKKMQTFGQIDAPVKGGNEIQQETLQNDTGVLDSRVEGGTGREGCSRRNGSVARLTGKV